MLIERGSWGSTPWAPSGRTAGRAGGVKDGAAGCRSTGERSERILDRAGYTLPAEIATAAHRACAFRAKELPFVFVPVDGSSLNISDWSREKDLGVVGARFVGATGLQVMSAIALAPDGTPVGICGQVYWARKGRARPKGKHDPRLVASKETQHWLTTMKHVREIFAEHAPSTEPWFQLDRAGDAWPVLLEGLHPGQSFTVRVAHNRRLLTSKDEPRRYLWDQVEAQSPLGRYSLDVPARAGRAARTAHIEVRTCEVTLDMLDERTHDRHPATLWAVLAREVETAPSDEEAIEWLLLSTRAMASMTEAERVLFGYAQRWRIEEFHRLWKTGGATWRTRRFVTAWQSSAGRQSSHRSPCGCCG